jgi:predicted outer membrane repeat protein
MRYHGRIRIETGCARLQGLAARLIVVVALMLPGCSEDPPVSGTSRPQDRRETIRVPQDQPTIQAAVDIARTGDTVLVAPGVYTGEGNSDIELGGRSLVLLSAQGPTQTIIAAGGSDTDYHRAFEFNSATGPGLLIDGFTITGGHAGTGGAIWMRSSSPIIRNCVFVDNTSEISGGAIRCKASSPWFVTCTFASNASPLGGALFCIAGSSPHFKNCIIAFNQSGGSVVCSGNQDQPVLECCNIYGNVDGDWNEDIGWLASLNGNLSADPLFCDLAGGNLYLHEQSPCGPEGNPCGQQIGALGVSVCSPAVPAARR